MLLPRAKSDWKWPVFWDYQLGSHSKCKLIIHHWCLHLWTIAYYLYSHWWLESYNIFLTQSNSLSISICWLNIFLSVTQGEWLTQSIISLKANKRSSNQVSLVLLQLTLTQSRMLEQEAVRLLAKHYHIQTAEM